MSIDYPPLEYYDVDGVTPIGFDVSLGQAIAGKLGLQAQFIDTTFEGIFAGVDTERFDIIISGTTWTEARAAAHNFTKPYMANAMAIVTLNNSRHRIQRPEDLNGLGVGYQAETTAKYFMEKLVAEGLRYNQFEYDQVPRAFDDLVYNRVDAVVTDLVVALEFIARPNSPYQVVWQGDVDEVFSIFLKKGNDALTQAIDRALDELFADGTMRRISYEILNVDMVTAARN
jgi:polar amino acid transport system substrate-binding protein